MHSFWHCSVGPQFPDAEVSLYNHLLHLFNLAGYSSADKPFFKSYAAQLHDIKNSLIWVFTTLAVCILTAKGHITNMSNLM